MNALKAFQALLESTVDVSRDVDNALKSFGASRDATAYQGTPDAQRSRFSQELLLSYWDEMVQDSTTCTPGTPRANLLKQLLSDFMNTRNMLNHQGSNDFVWERRSWNCAFV